MSKKWGNIAVWKIHFRVVDIDSGTMPSSRKVFVWKMENNKRTSQLNISCFLCSNFHRFILFFFFRNFFLLMHKNNIILAISVFNISRKVLRLTHIICENLYVKIKLKQTAHNEKRENESEKKGIFLSINFSHQQFCRFVIYQTCFKYFIAK